jgi:large subunit ribosomal protein L23
MSKTLAIRPRLSEKAYATSQALRSYAFIVPAGANKQTVAQAVAEQFGVTVLKVNILNTKGKVKRTVRKSGRSVHGQRSDMKKAYVTIKEGENIPIFAAEEEAAAKEATKAAKKEKK